MKVLYEGKTKDLLDMGDGNLLLKFKDTVTGAGGKIDPGANQIMGEVTDKGKASFFTSLYFFNKLEELSIPTHFVDADTQRCTMTVKAAESFGDGLEFICRRYAFGSFLRRYGRYASSMDELPCLVEITLKDDERGDPLINDDALLALGLLGEEELQKAKKLTVSITEAIESILGEFDLRLVDAKYEFGRVGSDVVLIDEISGDSMRVLDSSGSTLDQIGIYNALYGDRGGV